jgi:hypothetical protein
LYLFPCKRKNFITSLCSCFSILIFFTSILTFWWNGWSEIRVWELSREREFRSGDGDLIGCVLSIHVMIRDSVIPSGLEIEEFMCAKWCVRTGVGQNQIAGISITGTFLDNSGQDNVERNCRNGRIGSSHIRRARQKNLSEVPCRVFHSCTWKHADLSSNKRIISIKISIWKSVGKFSFEFIARCRSYRDQKLRDRRAESAIWDMFEAQ